MSMMKCVAEPAFSCRLRQSLLFVKLQTYTVNGSDRVCDGICSYNVQAFTINGSDKFYDGVCFTYSSADSWKPPVHVSDWLIYSVAEI